MNYLNLVAIELSLTLNKNIFLDLYWKKKIKIANAKIPGYFKEMWKYFMKGEDYEQ